MLDCDILTFEIARLIKSLAKRGKVGGRFRRRPRAQEPDDQCRRLLRMRRERPRRRAAEQRDEMAAGAHSITSSARASKIRDRSRPSALAALRLITNSNLVPCWTGKSAGFAPLRILST